MYDAWDTFYQYSEPIGPGFTNAGSPSTSRGGWCSTTSIPNAQRNQLFDDLTGDQNIALQVDYRCMFVRNGSDSSSFLYIKLFISQTAGGAEIAIGVDPTAASPIDSGQQQALIVPDLYTAPVGVTFSAPTSKASGLTFGDLPPGYVRAVWVRRTATNSDPLNTDSFTIHTAGETLA